MYTIYQHIFPNGKRYIGLTRTSIEERWGFRGYNYKTQFVGRAITKYGWENIQHEIICECDDKSDAEELERIFIGYYETTDPQYGYNVLPGGDVGVNDATPEMRKKLGNGMRGKHHTEETRRKISEGLKRAIENGTRKVRYGEKASEETREKMRKARAEWLSKGDNRQKEAERARERNKKIWEDESKRTKILGILEKYRRKQGSYSWSDESRKKLSESTKGKHAREKNYNARPVVQLTKTGEFVARHGCITSAAEAVAPETWESIRSTIGKCCRGQKNFNTCHGYKWMYEDEYLMKIT